MNMYEFKKRSIESGYNWFTQDTMDLWGSRVHDWDCKSGYFITSEDNFERTKKLYSIRKANFETLRVRTVSEYQEFSELKDARKAFKAFVDINKLTQKGVEK